MLCVVCCYVLLCAVCSQLFVGRFFVVTFIVFVCWLLCVACRMLVLVWVCVCFGMCCVIAGGSLLSVRCDSPCVLSVVCVLSVFVVEC